MNTNQIKQKIQNWATDNDAIRAVVLTSSMTNKTRIKPDTFSDFDVVVYK